MAENQKQKSLGFNALLNAIKNGLSILFPLITYPYAFRVLHSDGIGKVDYASSIVSYFSMIAALGINTYAVREGAKLRNDKARFNQFANEIYAVNLFTTIVAYMALCVFLLFTDTFRPYRTLIVILSTGILFTTLGVEWVNTVFEDYLFITLRSIMTHLVSLVLLFLLVRDEGDYYQYAFLTVLTSAIICLSNRIYCRKYLHLRPIGAKNLRRHVRPVLSLFANSLAIKIYASADTTMLGLMANDSVVGLYSIAVKIYNVIKYMLAAMYSVAVSRISFYIGIGEQQKVKETYTSILSGLILIMFPASVGLIAVSKEVILLVGGFEYLEAVPTLQILSIALIGAVLGGVVTSCLNIPLGREKQNILATSLSAILNVVLNLILIPQLAQNGAAITTAISEFFVFFFVIFTFKGHKDYVNLKEIRKSMLSAFVGCVSILLIAFIFRICFDNIWIILFGVILLSVITYILELLLFKNVFIMNLLQKMKQH